MGTSKQRLLPWAIVFVVGLLIGWLGLGWWLLPVRWINTDPVDLRPTARQQYLDMIAESYDLTKDAPRAQLRLQSWSREEAGRLVLAQADQYQSEGKLMEERRLRALAQALNLTGAATTQPQPTATRPTPATTPATGTRGRLAGLLGIGLAVPLLAIGGGILYYLWRQRRATTGEAPAAEPEEEEFAPAAAPAVRPAAARAARPAAPPAASMQEFTATYNLGDSEYDQSFTIEDASGNYRGECGIGVAEKVGSTAGPATALEVWLFDKSDIRTVTKLLLTDFAYNDPGIRSRLATKGDMVLAVPGQSFILETQALVAAAEITELDYATVDPPRSSMARLTVKLRVQAKE
ncbi:MAG: hypothetical protein IT330_18920 [Anaerolineae bacterium]|nr:hypothetical protein [Anaerolineae bacterium]